MPSSASSSAPEPAAALRLFLSIDAPASTVVALGNLTEPLAGCAWTPPEHLHLTLRFLGDTPRSLLQSLCERLREIRIQSFLLPVAGVGVFPPLGPPRVLWCGVGSGHPHLLLLRQNLDETLLSLGFAADQRIFVPHFALARLGKADPGRVAAWLRRHRDFGAPPFSVERFALYASELRPGGAVHTQLEQFRFGE